jgi:hypothetical protein
MHERQTPSKYLLGIFSSITDLTGAHGAPYGEWIVQMAL